MPWEVLQLFRGIAEAERLRQVAMPSFEVDAVVSTHTSANVSTHSTCETTCRTFSDHVSSLIEYLPSARCFIHIKHQSNSHGVDHLLGDACKLARPDKVRALQTRHGRLNPGLPLGVDHPQVVGCKV